NCLIAFQTSDAEIFIVFHNSIIKSFKAFHVVIANSFMLVHNSEKNSFIEVQMVIAYSFTVSQFFHSNTPTAINPAIAAITKPTGLIRKLIAPPTMPARSEEHTSELQSRFDLVCRLLLEKKKKTHKRRANK